MASNSPKNVNRFQQLTKAWAPPTASATAAAGDIFPPLCTIVLPPSSFSVEWARRPSEPVRVGLRLLSEGQMSIAAAMAEQEANAEYRDGGEGFSDAFGSHLMTNVLSRALTSAEDSNVLFFKEAPEAACRNALTTETVKRLWERYGKLAVEESPLTPEATDEEIAAFAVRLIAGAVTELASGPQRRMRRMLTELARELGQLPQEEMVPDASEIFDGARSVFGALDGDLSREV